MTNEKRIQVDTIKPGMAVEATQGDLGEEDLSTPKVADVIRDDAGNVEKIVVEKGAIFKKVLEIPVDRIEEVETKEEQGKVLVDVHETELEALNATGVEQLVGHEELEQQRAEMLNQQQNIGLLDQVEETMPTAEGLRIKEAVNTLRSRQSVPQLPQQEKTEQQANKHTGIVQFMRLLGPGFIAGMAGNDASAVTTYSIDGAQNGYGHLWLLLLSTPMYQAVQYTCAKVGQVTQMGLSEVLREHYGRWVASFAALILIIANLALIAADLVAISSGLELIMGINWIWFTVPIAALQWYVTVFHNFETIKKIFLIMSLAFVVYLFTAILSHPHWDTVLFNTVVPHIDLSFSSISAAVALLGATISPYNIFWQVQGEKEEKRLGSTRHKIRFAALDIAIGVISGNLIAYFIIVTTAATLFKNPQHPGGIATAADAAQSLVTILGPFAKYLFALGLIGAGLVAIPILLASTSYAVAGTFGWPVGLSKKPWQNEGFYLILTGALLISLGMALLRLDPITLIFWANVLSGILAPILVIFLIVIANNRKIMHGQHLSLLTNVGLVITILVMLAATTLLFYGLFTGQG